MMPEEVLETLPNASPDGAFEPAVRRRARDALESGHLLYFPSLRFELAPGERRLMDPASAGANRKNISLDPHGGRLRNAAVPSAEAEMLAAMMRRFAGFSARLVTGLFPEYAPLLERARTSCRPAEIAGRSYTPRHDDRLLHVDAFPSRPTRGRRILRVFSNVAPDGAPRLWQVGEPFADCARRFLPTISPPMPGSAVLLHWLGLTRGRRSSYDHFMLGLHDAMKLEAPYQSACPKAELHFPAGTTWMCFTDQVLHAALAGHCALEQTFHLPVTAQVHPDRSPLRVLEELMGRSLA